MFTHILPVRVNPNDSYEQQLLTLIGQMTDCENTLREHPFPLGLKLNEDLGCDSLSVAEIVIAMEQHFGVEISHDELNDIVRVDSKIEALYQTLVVELCTVPVPA